MLVIEQELLGIRKFLAKGKLKIGQQKYLPLFLCWILILGHTKLKTQTERKY